MIRLWKTLFSVVLLVTPALVSAADKPILSLMEIEDRSGEIDADDLEDAADFLRTALVQSNQYRVVPRSRQEHAIIRSKRKETYNGCYTEKCQIELGRELAADTILRSKISDFGGECTLSVVLFDLGTATAERAAKADFDCTGKGLKGAVKVVAHELVGRHLRPNPAPLAAGQTTNIGGNPGNWTPNAAERTIIQIDSEPPGAVVTMDGELLCKSTPCGREVTLGAHTFRMEYDRHRYLPLSRTLVVEGDDAIRWELEPNFGTLTVTSSPPGLGIILDSKVVGRTPVSRIELPPGKHRVLVGSDTHYKAGKEFTISRGEHMDIDLVPSEILGAISVSAVDEGGNALKAEVWIDGKQLDQTTPITQKIVIGPHRVRIVASGVAVEKALDVEEKETTRWVAALGLERKRLEMARLYEKKERKREKSRQAAEERVRERRRRAEKERISQITHDQINEVRKKKPLFLSLSVGAGAYYYGGKMRWGIPVVISFLGAGDSGAGGALLPIFIIIGADNWFGA